MYFAKHFPNNERNGKNNLSVAKISKNTHSQSTQQLVGEQYPEAKPALNVDSDLFDATTLVAPQYHEVTFNGLHCQVYLTISHQNPNSLLLI